MANSARLSLPLVAAGQANGEVTHNTAVQMLDAFTFLNIKDRDLATPPGSPANGDCYIVASSPTGAWTGHAGQVAIYNTGWLFIAPIEGMQAWIADEDINVTYDGVSWFARSRLMQISTSSSTAVANTTSETNFSVTATLPAVKINRVGRAFRVTARGILSFVSSATIVFKLKLGTTSILVYPSLGAGTTQTNLPWGFSAIIHTKATGASGSVRVSGSTMGLSGRSGTMPPTADVTVDLTAGGAVTVSAQWSAASASNTVQLDHLILEDLGDA